MYLIWLDKVLVIKVDEFFYTIIKTTQVVCMMPFIRKRILEHIAWCYMTVAIWRKWLIVIFTALLCIVQSLVMVGEVQEKCPEKQSVLLDQ